MMKTSMLLRIASVISLLFTAGHSLGGLQKWSPMGDSDVLRAMTSMRFDVMGVSRSYFDFYMGFGWSLSVTMLLQTVLLWQMASLARTNAVQVRPMIAAFVIATGAGCAIGWYFIFPIPALFASVLTLVLMAAYAVARSGQAPSSAS